MPWRRNSSPFSGLLKSYTPCWYYPLHIHWPQKCNICHSNMLLHLKLACVWLRVWVHHPLSPWQEKCHVIANLFSHPPPWCVSNSSMRECSCCPPQLQPCYQQWPWSPKVFSQLILTKHHSEQPCWPQVDKQPTKHRYRLAAKGAKYIEP